MLNFLPVAIALCGGYYLFRLRAFFLLHPRKTLSFLIDRQKEEGGGWLGRVSLAFAGTLGVGNITGVAAGILLGGAGSVFWLLVSALFSAPLKYAESVAVRTENGRDARALGLLPVIFRAFRKMGAPLAAVYAILSVLLAFFMGSALQIGAFCESMRASRYANWENVGLLLFLFLLVFCILGSSDKICKATSVLIPIAMVLYTILCLFAIFVDFSRIGSVLRMILADAFSFRAIAGGAVGAALRSPLREGFLRGLLSNEAGAGTSAYAHAKGKNASAAAEGILGMMEVLFDTVVLCMLTALAILLSVDDPSSFVGGMDLVIGAFSASLGAWCVPLLLLSVFLFALSTAVCWYEYGRCALSFFGPKGGRLYFLLYLLFALCGAHGKTVSWIFVSDGALFFLSLIALATLMKKRAAVCAETDRALPFYRRGSLGRTRRQ